MFLITCVVRSNLDIYVFIKHYSHINNVVCDIKKTVDWKLDIAYYVLPFQAMYLNGSVQNLYGKNHAGGRFGNAIVNVGDISKDGFGDK